MMNFLVMNYFVHDWPSDYHSTGKNKAAYEKQRLIDLPHITTIVEHVVVPLLPDNSSVIPLGEPNHEHKSAKLFPKSMRVTNEKVCIMHYNKSFETTKSHSFILSCLTC